MKTALILNYLLGQIFLLIVMDFYSFQLTCLIFLFWVCTLEPRNHQSNP